jgi:hypothetical protein
MSHRYAGAGATIGPATTFGYIPALDLAEACRQPPVAPLFGLMTPPGSGGRMGVGDGGKRPDMIAVQEGGGTRAS